MFVNGYRAMWLIVMFDLPVTTKRERKAATEFRKRLLEDGYSMAQYSVYLRPCPSEENAEVHAARIRSWLPKHGEVKLLRITDKQYGRIENFVGKKEVPLGEMPRQLQLF